MEGRFRFGARVGSHVNRAGSGRGKRVEKLELGQAALDVGASMGGGSRLRGPLLRGPWGRRPARRAFAFARGRRGAAPVVLEPCAGRVSPGVSLWGFVMHGPYSSMPREKETQRPRPYRQNEAGSGAPMQGGFGRRHRSARRRMRGGVVAARGGRIRRKQIGPGRGELHRATRRGLRCRGTASAFWDAKQAIEGRGVFRLQDTV